MDNIVVPALVATLGTWLMTALGAATVIFMKNTNQKAMNLMLGFAAGVMIAASFWSLLQPAIDRAEQNSKFPAWVVATLGFLCGAIFMWISDKIVPHADAPNASTASFFWCFPSRYTIFPRAWRSAWHSVHSVAAIHRRL